MTKDVKPKGAFWKKLRNHYRFQVIDTQTYDVRWVLSLSRLNVIAVFSVLFLVLLAISFAVFALTPLRFLLPGYVGTNAEEKRAIIELKMKTESLESKLKANDQYILAIKAILNDSMPLHDDIRAEEERLLQADAELFFPQAGKLESRFRKDYELLLKQGGGQEVSGKSYVLNLMQKPLDGKPLPQADDQPVSRTLRIKGKGDAAVTSVLSGLVIARYKVGTEIHLYIQHDEYLVSAYKYEGEAEVNVGDRVDGGQLIGSLAEKGELVLNFDLWANGEAIPSGQYFKF